MQRFAFLVVLASLALAGCVRPGVQARVESSHPVVSPKRLDELVAFHEERVRNDPKGVLGLNLLANAYLDVASEKDDDSMAERAEKAARRSLEIRTRGNESAAMTLARALLAQHRFREALAASNQALKIDPSNRAAKRQNLEILLEVGDYKMFRTEFPKVGSMTDPATLALKARWASLTGEPEQALKLWEKALEQVDGIKTLPGSTVAWYRVQHGAAQFQAGHLDEAELDFKTALILHPTGYQAHGWLARLAAGRGDWEGVIKHGEAASRQAKLTDIEGLMVRAERHLGVPSSRLDTLKSDNGVPATFKMTHHSHEKSTSGRHTHDRLTALALADLGDMAAYAHHTAEEDLANRRDIYALDAFAWATFRYWELVPASETGEGDFLLKEAAKAIDEALALGTQDAKLLFHTGRIYESLDKQKSDLFYAQALKVNPHFDADEVAHAKRALSD